MNETDIPYTKDRSGKKGCGSMRRISHIGNEMARMAEGLESRFYIIVAVAFFALSAWNSTFSGAIP